MTAAKEPSKRQKKQKQKRKQHKQDQKQTEETSVPALAISWAEQEAMLAESATLVAQWVEHETVLTPVSQDVDSEVEFVDEEDEAGGADSEVEIVIDAAEEGAVVAPVSELTTPAAARAEPRNHDGSLAAGYSADGSSGERPPSPPPASASTAAALSSDDEAWRQTVQVRAGCSVLLKKSGSCRTSLRRIAMSLHRFSPLTKLSTTTDTTPQSPPAPPRDVGAGCARSPRSDGGVRERARAARDGVRERARAARDGVRDRSLAARGR